MIKRFKRKVLTRCAHLLYPYLKRETEANELSDAERIINSFQSCGHNINLYSWGNMIGLRYVCIGDNFSAGYMFRMEALDKFGEQHFTPSITIGNNVTFEDFCHVGCVESVFIGDGCMFASKVFISDHEHGMLNNQDLSLPPAKRNLSHRPIHIGKNVWVGDGVCILPGVTLGDNVVVGSNAVVTKSFPSNCVIAGVPAKVIKYLDEKV